MDCLESRILFATVATGIQATYYDNTNFAGTNVTRVDRAVDFNWASGSPAASIAADTFSVRWTGRVKATTSEIYRLYVLTQSPVRVWVQNQLVVDGWKSTATAVNYKGSVALAASTRYDLQVEMLHNTGPASVKLAWQTDTVVKQTVPNRLLLPASPTLRNQINHVLSYASDRALQQLRTTPTPASGYPESTNSDGTWKLTNAAAWTSGYFGGVLWQLDARFPGKGFDTRATTWTTPLASQKSQSGDHFSRLWTTFKPLYDKTGNASYRQVLLDAAASKGAQFNAQIGAFRTPEIASNSGNAKATFGILVDQTLDLELMFWASEQSGDPIYREHAVKHLETVIARMVRSDGSVFQRFFFDGTTGAPIGGENYQGYSNSSTWSRGQAWALYGFSRIAELTGRADFLAAAKKVAGYFVSHLPADGVPYWDFQAPGIPKTYRDTSAAAIAARGLIRLSVVSGDPTYRTSAEKILSSLLSPIYLTEGTSARGVLRHAALSVPKIRGVDVSLIFADYYLLEAINAYTKG